MLRSLQSPWTIGNRENFCLNDNIVTHEDYEERIDEYLDGFAVYEKKVVIYGSDGLYVGDV